MTPAETEALKDLCARLKALAGDARHGLPHEVFLLVSQLTPMVNVDLLLRNDAGQSLLTWRADEFYGPGWHIPGGIVRFKESFADRIQEVARIELGCSVSFNPTPIAMNEVTAAHRDVRGHFVSLLFECRLSSPLAEALKFSAGMPKNGQWQWHDHCPDNLIRVHEMYRPHIGHGATSPCPAEVPPKQPKHPERAPS